MVARRVRNRVTAPAKSFRRLETAVCECRRRALSYVRYRTNARDIRQMIVAINKADLVDFEQKVFDSLCRQFQEFAKSMPAVALHYGPLSALEGDNVIKSSDRRARCEAASLLHLLETLSPTPDGADALRFPVQNVVRPNQDFRGYAGQVSSGWARPGQEVVRVAL
jgi:bifunctional enzyme CysN/CysC